MNQPVKSEKNKNHLVLAAWFIASFLLCPDALAACTADPFDDSLKCNNTIFPQEYKGSNFPSVKLNWTLHPGQSPMIHLNVLQDNWRRNGALELKGYDLDRLHVQYRIAKSSSSIVDCHRNPDEEWGYHSCDISSSFLFDCANTPKEGETLVVQATETYKKLFSKSKSYSGTTYTFNYPDLVKDICSAQVQTQKSSQK